ncbi:hypothetical protein ABW20_dc0101394 [Dactylellina cionopaga]|nr:hypothetical protein ABW20_dc0101394 [Dactylellina cionopaga]
MVSSLPTADPSPANVPAKYNPTAGNTIVKYIRVKDVYPNATNGDAILGKIWKDPIHIPGSTSPTANATVDKRQNYNLNCYNGPGAWAAQNGLWNAIGQVCNWMQTYNPVQNGQQAHVEWDSYQDPYGNVNAITDINNIPVRGIWVLNAPYNGYFDWNTCFNIYFEIVWNCRGSNPDTAGGWISGYSLVWAGGVSFWYP